MNRVPSFSNLRRDIPASIAVFLVALPLCMGIALASHAPIMAGLVAGIIGGLIVGSISGSHTSVSGPAAGLTAVAVAAIGQLGSFENFLVAVFLAGILQLALGIARAGLIANYFPTAVIKGLLTAIGVILILKQIPHAVGYDRDYEGEFSFFQEDQQNTFSELFNIIHFITPGAVIISFVGLAAMILWDRSRLKKLPLPSPLIAVTLGAVINYVLSKTMPDWSLGGDHLVIIPKFDRFQDLFGASLPNWQALRDTQLYVVAVTLAIVASLETLLNLEAIDKLDEHKRYSPPNRELVAQGIGNILCGLTGALPVTSVVVRSSVNVQMGAASKASAILHGALLVGCVWFIPTWLDRIPLASLAAVLLLTGYKLASPKQFLDQYHKGWSQFVPFVATVLAIVFTDLLVGILVGLAVGVFFILRNNLQSPFQFVNEKYHAGELIRLKLGQQVTFLNRASFLVTLDKLPANSHVLLDASDTDFIDPDIMEIFKEFRDVKAPEKGIQLSMKGFRDQYAMHDHIQYVTVLTKEAQQSLRPADVLRILQEGNSRFVRGERMERDLLHQVALTSQTQHPMAAVLGCIDSRTTSELIFDLGLGDIFSIRLAGNVANTDVLGSLEFASHVAGARLIVVLGHTGCGAIKAACDQIALGHLTELVAKIRPAVERETTTSGQRNGANRQFVDSVARNNVELVMDYILTESPIVAEMVEMGTVAIVGGMYDIHSGQVDFFTTRGLPSGQIKTDRSPLPTRAPQPVVI